MSEADEITVHCTSCKRDLLCPATMRGKWIRCPACKVYISVPTQPQEETESETATEQRTVSEDNRYPATTVIILANKILGICSFVLGIMISFALWEKTESGALFLVGLVLSTVVWLIFRSAAEALQVFLDIEKNTRKTSEALLEYLREKGV